MEGNFALNKNTTNDELTSKLEKDGLKCEKVTVKVEVSKGDVLSEFWDKHGRHYKNPRKGSPVSVITGGYPLKKGTRK